MKLMKYTALGIREATPEEIEEQRWEQFNERDRLFSMLFGFGDTMKRGEKKFLEFIDEQLKEIENTDPQMYSVDDHPSIYIKNTLQKIRLDLLAAFEKKETNRGQEIDDNKIKEVIKDLQLEIDCYPTNFLKKVVKGDLLYTLNESIKIFKSLLEKETDAKRGYNISQKLAALITEKMEKRAHHGDWKDYSLDKCFNSIGVEVEELYHSLSFYTDRDTLPYIGSKDSVRDEIADVAAYCAIMLDVLDNE